MVSQGAAPIGPELTITAAEGHVIGELAGKPALEKLRETIESLAARGPAAGPGRAADGDRGRLQQARLRAGRLPRARARRRRPGDRPGRGRRRRAPRPGRAAARARRRERRPRPARGAVDADDRAGRPAAGGRARVRLQRPRRAACSACADHDAEVVADALAGAPAAGFFAAGEIGPVGGGYFLHSFTATVAVFARVNAAHGARACLLHRRDRRARAGDRAGAGRARGATLIADRAARRRARAAGGGDRRPRDRVRPRAAGRAGAAARGGRRGRRARRQRRRCPAAGGWTRSASRRSTAR